MVVVLHKLESMILSSSNALSALSKSLGLLVDLDSTSEVLEDSRRGLVRIRSLLIGTLNSGASVLTSLVGGNVLEGSGKGLLDLVVLELRLLRCLGRVLSLENLLRLGCSCFALSSQVVHVTQSHVLFGC